MGVIEAHRERLPVGAETPELSLGEGGTPLVAVPNLGDQLGVELHVKLEGLNPTGSFKDRGMVVAVAKAVEAGARAVVCASTGNTAASAAAYAARAGLQAVVLTPVGAVATAKRAQSVAAGARLLDVAGSFDEALRACRALAEQDGFVLVNSLNPHRVEGQKTAVFELLDQLGRAPDVIALPYGGGGNLCAFAKGLAEAGAPTLLVAGEAAARPTTFASAIRIAEPAHEQEVQALVAAGRAEIVTLADDELQRAWADLAREGVFCEPASAAGLAALRRRGVEPGSLAVCILTGHGLKDAAAVDRLQVEPTVVEPSLEAILEVLA
ncbi:MAG TPA: threonine synthase [Gaiellaceae bacterium]